MKKLCCSAVFIGLAFCLAAQQTAGEVRDPLKIEITQDQTDKGTITLAYIPLTHQARVIYTALDSNYAHYDGSFDADAYFWDAITTIRAKANSFMLQTKGDNDNQRYYHFYYQAPERATYGGKNKQTAYTAYLWFFD
jgi:hypothetical protein